MEAAVSTGGVSVAEAPSPAPELPVPGEERAPLVRHPVPVAVVATALGILAYVGYSKVADGLIAAFMAVVLVVLGATDLERRIIPNRIVLPATAIVLVARIAVSPGRSLEWVLSALGAAVVLFLPNLINSSAIGMGDVKLGLFLGAGLGVAVVGALIVGFLSIFPVALWTLIRKGMAARKAALPLGPFLAFGGLVVLIVPALFGHGAS